MLELICITLFMGIIPAFLTGLKRFKIGPIAPFVYLTAFSVVYETIFSLILKRDSSGWFAVYDILEFFSISYYFYKLNFPKYKRLSFAFVILFLISQVSQHFFINEEILSQPISSFVYTLYIFIFTTLWFVETFSKMENHNLWSIPDFYYISGIFIFHSTTFLLFLLSDIIMKLDSEKLMEFWILNIIASLLLRFFLIIGIWKTSLK